MDRRRLRTAARKDADQVAKLVTVQERQIDALKAENAALTAVLVGVAHLTFDYIDMTTGEVVKRPLFPEVGFNDT